MTINRKILDRRVECAIKCGILIDFDEESNEFNIRYMQKSADKYRSIITILLSGSLFIMSVGWSMASGQIFKEEFHTLPYLTGIIYMFFGIILIAYFYLGHYKRCNETILEAERRILDISESLHSNVPTIP